MPRWSARPRTVPGPTDSVVIVGAGLGGLSAALRLAGAGRRVTVVERADVPGGRAGVLHRGGYSFDTGPTVLTMPELLDDALACVGEKLSDRLELLAGDMFAGVPAADAYSLKLILHDWNDEECVAILKNLRAAATGPRRVFIVEHIVTGPEEPHFAKLFDIHMLCWGTGRERTEAEYIQLLDAAGFRHVRSWYPAGGPMGVIEGVAV